MNNYAAEDIRKQSTRSKWDDSNDESSVVMDVNIITVKYRRFDDIQARGHGQHIIRVHYAKSLVGVFDINRLAKCQTPAPGG